MNDNPWERRRKLAQFGCAASALIVLSVRALPPDSYLKDFKVEALMGMALRDHLDIYSPLGQLSDRYLPPGLPSFPHPSPYPPIVAALGIPFSFIPMPILIPLWLLFGILLVVVVGRWLGLSTRASLALAAWPPLWWVLDIGQVEVLILVLALLAWRDAAHGKDRRAGVWLGIAATIKLYPALFLLPYLYRRRAWVILAAGCAFLLGQLANVLIVGPTELVHYYRDILPSVGVRYVGQGLNGSPYGTLLRLFGGASDVVPIVHAPFLITPIAIAFALAGLVALALLEPEAAPPAAFLVLPTAWGYYAVLVLPLIVKMVRRQGWSLCLAGAAVATSVALPFVVPLVVAVEAATGPNNLLPSVVATSLLALQPIGYALLVALVARRGLALRRTRSALQLEPATVASGQM